MSNKKRLLATNYETIDLWETILFFLAIHVLQGMKEGKYLIPTDLLLVHPSEARMGVKIKSNLLLFRCEIPTEEAVREAARAVTKAYEALTALDFPFLRVAGVKVIPADEKGEYLLRVDLKKAA